MSDQDVLTEPTHDERMKEYRFAVQFITRSVREQNYSLTKALLGYVSHEVMSAVRERRHEDMGLLRNLLDTGMHVIAAEHGTYTKKELDHLLVQSRVPPAVAAAGTLEYCVRFLDTIISAAPKPPVMTNDFDWRIVEAIGMSKDGLTLAQLQNCFRLTNNEINERLTALERDGSLRQHTDGRTKIWSRAALH